MDALNRSQGVKWLLGIGLLVIPWVWWPWSAVAYELPRVTVFWWFVLGLSGASLWRCRFGKANTKMVILVLSWVVWSFWVSRQSLAIAMVGNYYRSDGLITLLSGVMLGLVVSRSNISGVYLARWLWIAVLIVSLFSGGVGVFGNSHLLAGYIVMGIAATVGLWIKGKLDVGAAAISLALLLLKLGLTQAWLMLGLGMVIISWKWIFESKWRWLPLVLTLLFLIAFIGWVFRPVKNFDAESRARMWRRGVMAWQAKPITGWGWSGFAQAIETYDWPYPVRFDVYVDKAHSSMVERFGLSLA